MLDVIAPAHRKDHATRLAVEQILLSDALPVDKAVALHGLGVSSFRVNQILHNEGIPIKG